MSIVNELLLLRFKFTPQTTLGNLFYQEYPCKMVWFGYTLEDTLRPPNIKVFGHTAIQDGVYPLSIVESPKFKRKVIQINDVATHSKVYFHGLNNHTHSLGCVGVAKETNGVDAIWNSLETKLFNMCEQYINSKHGMKLRVVTLGNI